jgi:DNA polymerase III subunit epsilon
VTRLSRTTGTRPSGRRSTGGRLGRRSRDTGNPRWLTRLPASVVFCDVETTGFTYTDRIVTFAAIGLQTASLASGRLDLEYEYLIFNPGIDSHPRAAEVHGYSDSRLRLQNPFGMHAEDIWNFLSDYELHVAHNASFDFGFINREMTRAGLEELSQPIYCTMQKYRLLGFEGSSSLDAVCEKINLSRAGNLHGALEDAWLAMRVYLWLHDCPFSFDFPRGLPDQPTNLLDARRVPKRTPQPTDRQEIRLPQPTRPPTAVPPQAEPVAAQTRPPQIEIRCEATEEIPVVQPPRPTIPDRSAVITRTPQHSAGQHDYKPSPTSLGEKIEALFMLVTMIPFLTFMFVLPALLLAGIPIYLVLQFGFNVILPEWTMIPLGLVTAAIWLLLGRKFKRKSNSI